jgi:methionine synthase II (cobalamin-independent)
MTFKPGFLATGIGSMPFQDAGHAVDVSIARVSGAPFWPQLPKSSLNEQMEIQYSGGMPRAVIDREKKRLYFDTTGDYSEEFAAFYEQYMLAMDEESGTGDCSGAAIGPDFARGIYAMEKKLKALGRKLPFIKVQTTGPCSFSLTIVDENKRALYYNEEFRDMIVKTLAMKCRWQIQKFKPYAEKIICFIDEPILSAFGSSTYVSVKREDVVSLLNEVIGAVHADGAIAGVHCCGNTEWSILVDAGADVVNFDAFDFGETIAMYPKAVNDLFDRGGALAWGIVPTSSAIRQETPGSLADRLEKLMENLASRGVDKSRIAEQAMITPSCGTGSMESDDAEKVFIMLQDMSREMRKRYGF